MPRIPPSPARRAAAIPSGPRRSRLRGARTLAPGALALLLAALAFAPAAAELDPDFGGFSKDGAVQLLALPSIEDTALQPDGKIVVVGGDAAARYGPRGVLDESFGSGGVAPLPGVQAHAVAVQPGGGIVVAGKVGGGAWGVTRLLADGDVDSSFGSRGIGTTDFGGRAGDLMDLALQPDGRILVAGWEGGDSHNIAVARFLADGGLDAGFGEGGEVSTGVGGSAGRDRDHAHAIALQPDRKIVVAGSWMTGLTDPIDGDITEDFYFGVVRYHPDGTLDESFDGDGKRRVGFGGAFDNARAVAVQPDGRIVVAGPKLTLGSNGRIAMARLEPDGSLDESFDGDGKLETDLVENDNDGAWAMALQGDGKIVLAADAGDTGVLLRYRPDGRLDPDFGFVKDPDASDFRTLLLQPDGRLVVSDLDGTLRRFGTNGRPDVGGSVARDFAHAGDRAFDVAVEPDGGLLVAGHAETRTIGGRQVAVARFRPDGSPDADFGVDGRAYAGVATDDWGRAMALTRTGRIRIAGAQKAESIDLSAYGLEADGTPDLGFSRGGFTAVDFGCEGGDQGNAMLRQPDGKLVVAGSAPAALFGGDCGPLRMAVARFDPDGRLDREGFSGDGLTTGNVSSGSGSFSVATDVARQSSGRIVVAGWGENESSQHVGLLGLEPDGAVDLAGFGFRGDVRTEVGEHSRAEAIALQPDDGIVLVGHSDREDDGDFLVARYTERGALDPSFGDGGVVLTDFGGDEAAYDVVLQADGGILVAGSRDTLRADSPIHLARYLPDGRLDRDFGEGGKETLLLSSGVAVRALALHPPGGVVVAGFADNRSDDDFFVARALVPAPEPGSRALGSAALAALALLAALSRAAGGHRAPRSAAPR